MSGPLSLISRRISTSDYAELLTPDESARAARFYFERHQNRYVVGRGVLRTLLGAYLHLAPETIRFAYGPQGKPDLSHNFPDSDLCFNLAHSEGLALVAVTRSASIGVDVERVRRLPEFNELVNRFFSPRESELFAKVPEAEKPQAFFNLWTRKEAWLKATGDGIASLLPEVNVSFLQNEPARLLSLPRTMNTTPRSRAAHCVTLDSWSLCDLRPSPGIHWRARGGHSRGSRSLFQLGTRASRPGCNTGGCLMTSSATLAPNMALVKPPIAILGVPFDNVTTATALDALEQMIASGQPHYAVTANIDFLSQARNDVELRRILFDAHLVLCDGTPLLWASKLLGNPLPERVAGSDLVPKLIEKAAAKNYRLFFLGSTPAGTRGLANLKERYPGLEVFHYSPPFNKLLEMDHEAIVERIREVKPDVLLVCFGCPKQEKWIAMHYRSLGVPVAIGVGATLDFIAGHVRRAPVWMQRSGLEWIFRLVQEPKRLFRRYAQDVFIFSSGFASQWWSLQKLRSRPGSQADALQPMPANPGTNTTHFTLPARLDYPALLSGALPMQEILNRRVSCILDSSAVQFIDSSGIGGLVGLHKKLRSIGCELILFRPAKAVRRALAMMRLQDFFHVCESESEVQSLLERERAGEPAPRPSHDGSFAWRGEVTAAPQIGFAKKRSPSWTARTLMKR